LNLNLTEADLSIVIKRTPQQDVKSNVTQDDEQHNTTIRRKNHKKTQKKKLNIRENHEKAQKRNLNICENHLFKLKKEGKRCRRTTLCQIDLKQPLPITGLERELIENVEFIV